MSFRLCRRIAGGEKFGPVTYAAYRDLAMSNIAQIAKDLWLVPVRMPKTPVTVPAVESARPPPPESRPPVAIARADRNAEGNGRSVEDWARRRRCVIVSRCGCSVRLDRVGASIRAQSKSEPEREYRQSCHNNFCSHVDIPFVNSAIEPVDDCEVARNLSNR